MTAQIIDGKAFAETMRASCKTAGPDTKIMEPPGLTVILVVTMRLGAVYVRNKHLACEKVGITHTWSPWIEILQNKSF